MLPLRPYQQSAIEKFFSRPDKRLIFAMATGSGKTRTALEVRRRLDAQKLLVIGSAQSRATWPKEADYWQLAPDLYSVRYGKANKSLTKKQAAERDAAYAADKQVISYALLKHLDAGPRNLVIIDEAHALKNPLSAQSRAVKNYFRAYPKVPALLLTATPIPNEVADIWNLVDTLWPNYLGRPTESGDVSWDFKRKYCQSELREWDGGSATHYFGAKQEALPALAKKLEPIMHRVSSAEVAQYTPKLNASILWIDEPRVKDEQIAADWLEAREADGSTHVGLFSWQHATVHKLAAEAARRGWSVVMVTGLMHPEQRANILDHARTMPRCCLVGTAGSLAESISLSFVKQALVFEWRATPGQAVQFSGRFARSDSKTMDPTFLQYVARTDDEVDAKRLRERLDAASALYEQDSRATQLYELFQPRVVDESMLAKLADAMFSEVRASLGFVGDEDDG